MIIKNHLIKRYAVLKRRENSTRTDPHASVSSKQKTLQISR